MDENKEHLRKQFKTTYCYFAGFQTVANIQRQSKDCKERGTKRGRYMEFIKCEKKTFFLILSTFLGGKRKL